MTFEFLANELLLNVFEYMPMVNILNGFYGLNHRFNTLVYVHFRHYHFHCQSMQKVDFDHICRNHLPHLVDQIHSIRLSNDEETPQQIESFLSHSFQLNQFISLRSLTLSHLRSPNSMNLFLIQCQDLPWLSHLDFINCLFHDGRQLIIPYLNHLWNLPRLKRCHMEIDIFGLSYKIVPSTVSNTLQHLSIESYSYNNKELFHLLKMTPAIRYLSILIEDDDTVDSIVPFSLTSVTRLNLTVYRSSKTMIHLLQSVPNLHHLTVATDEVVLNGEQWERLIIKHLPKLRIFQLKMLFRFDDDQNMDQRANERLNTFRTSFWLTERRWFVRCDWNRCDECDKNNICLYTLPYGFDTYFLHNAECKSISTESENHLLSSSSSSSSSYEHVNYLAFALEPSDVQLPSFFSFSNLTSLDIEFPAVNEHLHSTLGPLHQLKYLRITKFQREHPRFDPLQVQNLLNQMKQLYSITFQAWSSTTNQMPPFNLTNPSVRRLNLRDTEQYYNANQCRNLTHSSLGRQCEVLMIAVENRSNILDLIHEMHCLRSLNVICRDDTWRSNNISRRSTVCDELIEWLDIVLPTGSTISRSTERIYDNEYRQWSSIQMWLR